MLWLDFVFSDSMSGRFGISNGDATYTGARADYNYDHSDNAVCDFWDVIGFIVCQINDGKRGKN